MIRRSVPPDIGGTARFQGLLSRDEDERGQIEGVEADGSRR